MPQHPIELNVLSTAGSWNHAFASGDIAQMVIDASVEHFHLATGPGISYVLKRPNGSILAPGETLEQLGLRSGDEVLLQASQAQDG